MYVYRNGKKLFNSLFCCLDEDLQLLPLIVVILGCVACLLFIINILILVLQRIQSKLIPKKSELCFF